MRHRTLLSPLFVIHDRECERVKKSQRVIQIIGVKLSFFPEKLCDCSNIVEGVQKCWDICREWPFRLSIRLLGAISRGGEGRSRWIQPFNSHTLVRQAGED